MAVYSERILEMLKGEITYFLKSKSEHDWFVRF